jgi:hypothetical protein
MTFMLGFTFDFSPRQVALQDTGPVLSSPNCDGLSVPKLSITYELKAREQLPFFFVDVE